MKRTIIEEKYNCSLTLVEEDDKKDIYEVKIINKIKCFKTYLRARYYFNEWTKKS